MGLITFNKNVHVYELGCKINTIFSLNGAREYSNLDIMGLLGISINKNDPNCRSYEIFKRFIVQIKTKADVQKITRRVRDLKRDQTITVN